MYPVTYRKKPRLLSHYSNQLFVIDRAGLGVQQQRVDRLLLTWLGARAGFWSGSGSGFGSGFGSGSGSGFGSGFGFGRLAYRSRCAALAIAQAAAGWARATAR